MINRKDRAYGKTRAGAICGLPIAVPLKRSRSYPVNPELNRYGKSTLGKFEIAGRPQRYVIEDSKQHLFTPTFEVRTKSENPSL